MASVIRKAKVFRNGGSQAIRLPKDFRVAGDEVLLKQDFGVITIIPESLSDGSLRALLEAMGPIELAPRDQPGWTDKRAGGHPAPNAPRRPCQRAGSLRA